MRKSIYFISVPLLFTLVFQAAQVLAADADPSNYTSVLSTLKPGDTLNLSPGVYTQGLNISNLNGGENAWITIAGPQGGQPAVFEGNACCNTVEIKNSSYVAVRGITVDGKGIPGVFGVSAKAFLSVRADRSRPWRFQPKRRLLAGLCAAISSMARAPVCIWAIPIMPIPLWAV